MDNHTLINLNDDIMLNLMDDLVDKNKVSILYVKSHFTLDSVINDYYYYAATQNNVEISKRHFVLLNDNLSIKFSLKGNNFECSCYEDYVAIKICRYLTLKLEITQSDLDKYLQNNSTSCNSSDDKEDSDSYFDESFAKNNKPFETSIDFTRKFRWNHFYGDSILEPGICKLKNDSFINFMGAYLTEPDTFIELTDDNVKLYLKDIKSDSYSSSNSRKFYAGNSNNIALYKSDDELYDFIVYCNLSIGETENISIKIDSNFYVHSNNNEKGRFNKILKYQSIKDEIDAEIEAENREIERQYWSSLSSEESEAWDNLLED